MTMNRKLEDAAAVCQWLARKGLSVARVEISSLVQHPRIRLTNRPTDILSVEITEMFEGTTRRFREATVSGCRIEWEV